jgi:2-polyprenyl-6-methoxyphenol hydroxylase-like FAD-dependent oxidoreductase
MRLDHQTMPEADFPVMIVGGGPVGLSASLLLSRHGARSVLFERHFTTSVHPKARGLNVRTLELFRVRGIESAVRVAAKDLDRAQDVVWAPTLLAPETRLRHQFCAPDRSERSGLASCNRAGSPGARPTPSLLRRRI